MPRTPKRRRRTCKRRCTNICNFSFSFQYSITLSMICGTTCILSATTLLGRNYSLHVYLYHTHTRENLTETTVPAETGTKYRVTIPGTTQFFHSYTLCTFIPPITFLCLVLATAILQQLREIPMTSISLLPGSMYVACTTCL